MKQKSKKRLNILISICYCVILCLSLSACSSVGVDDAKNTVVLVKNTDLPIYGTGFAVGVPGEATDTIVTAYSVVATSDGTMPKIAGVSINESTKNLTANVVYCDEARNVAVLKLPEKLKNIKPLVLKDTVNLEDAFYAIGYDGSGTMMLDYKKFSIPDVVKYRGHINPYIAKDSINVYKYSKSFNRALMGAPVTDAKEKVIGMCVYLFNNKDAYTQYILSAEELSRTLSEGDITYMTAQESYYKNIIMLSAIAGVLLMLALLIIALIAGNKKEKNLNLKNTYIKITGGTLAGLEFKFDDKLVIGKNSTECNVVYPADEPDIQDKHCTVLLYEGAYYLVDHFTPGGTFLGNGEQVEARYPHKIEKKNFAFYVAKPENRFEFVNRKEKKR